MLAALTKILALPCRLQDPGPCNQQRQLGDHRVADAVAQTVERHRQRPCALARPPQRRVGIAERQGGRLDQRIQIAQQPSRSRSIERLRPPPRTCRVRSPERAARPPSRITHARGQALEWSTRCRDTRGDVSGDQRRAAITDRLKSLTWPPTPARSLREHRAPALHALPGSGGQLCTGAAYYSPASTVQAHVIALTSLCARLRVPAASSTFLDSAK